jgi:hypothetical protein
MGHTRVLDHCGRELGRFGGSGSIYGWLGGDAIMFII